jgi:hypothetical protein
MNPSLLQEKIYVSRAVLKGLETLSILDAAKAGDDRPLTTGVDAIADQIIRAHLEQQPHLAERQKAVREFFKTLDGKETV